VARMTASVDLLSGGRFGWNVVTGQNRYEAALHGYESQPSHADRYDRAEEFVDVVRDLWSTWRDGAPTPDVSAGRVFDPARVHHVHHRGKHFRVDGRLNVPPSRQGRPVVVQAGASDAGIRLAARTADLTFVASPTMHVALDYRRRMTTAAHACERRPPLVLAGIMSIIGTDLTDARASLVELDDLVPEPLRLHVLQHQLGFSIERLDLDGPLPSPTVTESAKSRQAILVEMARRDGMTIRELARVVAASRGHFLAVGDPPHVADTMEEWFLVGACDGFFVMGATLPASLRAFTEQVLPILTERRLFRPVDTGVTLAQNLGLWDGTAL
ncbi:MAG: nitrilotriacetate monooxygenase, partial [Rhodobacterales bacterium]